MRSIWKGSVSFGLVSIGVKLYSATEERDVSFHQVRRSDGSRIRYKRVAESDVEAARLQGAISPRVEAKLDEILGHPVTCPHGNPIDADTARKRPAGTPLSQLESGSKATVFRITEEAEEDAVGRRRAPRGREARRGHRRGCLAHGRRGVPQGARAHRRAAAKPAGRQTSTAAMSR